MSHATHWGFSGPPFGATCLCSSPPDPPWLRGALVGVLYDSLTASGNCPRPIRPSPLSFQSRALGVGHRSSRNHEPASRLRIDGASWFALAVGVCNKPEPVASVRGANGRSRDAVPLRVIPARGQVSENTLKPPSKESCDVLHDDVAGSKLANESRVLAPKTRACPVDSSALAGEADVLAGESAAEDVDVWHRHGHSPDFTFTVSDVIVFRGPPGIRAFIAMCASGVFPSS